jgi:hypothetical protein
MLYLIPALAVVVAGGIVGGLVSPFARSRPAAAFGRRAAWGVALTVVGAVLAAWALPERPAPNAPIGATCEDTDSALFVVLVGLAVASFVAGAAVVAAATIEGVKRAATGATFGRLAFAVAAPHVALGALLFSWICDYS